MCRLGGIGLVVALLVAVPGRAQPAAADEQTLSKGQVGSDGQSLITFFKLRTLNEANRQRIASLIRQLGHDAYAIRERASGELVDAGLPAVGALRQATTDPDVEIARRAERCLKKIERVPSAALTIAAARVIAVRKPTGAVSVLFDFLPLADDSLVADEIREALCVLAAAGGPPDPLFEKALDDDVPARRAAAAVALIRSGQPDSVKAARRALADKTPEVRLRASLALVTHAKDRSAVPGLIALLGELPTGQAWPVLEVLERLAGETAPRVPVAGDDAGRRKSRDAWQEWWTQNGATVDLAKLDAEPAMLGLTLVVVASTRRPALVAGAIGPITGSVMEVDPAKNISWRIDGLATPIDAAVLGSDRVAIVEQGNSRVTVRDFRGKEIWSHQVPTPNGVQRLPNGNFLVCARSQLLEFDTSFQKVFEYNRSGSDIVAAHKLRNGEVVILTNNGTVVRLDATRKVIKSFPTQAQIQTVGGLDVLSNGNILKTSTTGIHEYNAEGVPTAWQAAYQRPYSVQRLPNGNTLVASLTNGIAELDRDSKQPVWEYKPPDGSSTYRAKRR
ncbi:MAG: hypothetical protein U0746_05670 [Gemmataceae bacterium]